MLFIGVGPSAAGPGRVELAMEIAMAQPMVQARALTSGNATIVGSVLERACMDDFGDSGGMRE